MKTKKLVNVLIMLVLECLGFFYASSQTSQTITLETRSTGSGYTLCGSCTLPAEIFSHVWLVSNDEPGEHIVLSGTIYREDGVTPDSGITLFLYQTDAEGYYHRPKEDVFHPRIYGWLRTGNDGRYEIHTIKPAPEVLAADEPAHIHVHIFGKGIPEHFLHEFWFQGDNRITKKDVQLYTGLGDVSPIVMLTRAKDGIWRGTRNIKVKPAPQWRYEDN